MVQVAQRARRLIRVPGRDGSAPSLPGVRLGATASSPREFLTALMFELGGEAPNAIHPVNWMGRTIWLLERLAPRSGKKRQLAYGIGVAAAVPTLYTWLAMKAQRRAYGQGQAEGTAVSGALLKTTFAVRALDGAASRVKHALQDEDMDGAREAVRGLVSRPTEGLTPGQIASAAIESLAENTTDSFLAPWFYYAIGGMPAAFFYRAVNTLDSRLGYRDERRRYVGWASARLDDLLNFVPARIGGGLIVLAAMLCRQNAGEALRTMGEQHGRTASPNAGWTMSAMSGALGTRLKKPGAYELGQPSWRQPTTKDIGAATWMMYAVAAMAAGAMYGVLTLRSRFTSPRR
ncbi:MAG: cobalamin biosynthesis protein CobD [Dehalococcoidia bacterium]|nr:cobalamin biosynthesis protein CobD [Dehalococcoidia bacterium]